MAASSGSSDTDGAPQAVSIRHSASSKGRSFPRMGDLLLVSETGDILHYKREGRKAQEGIQGRSRRER